MSSEGTRRSEAADQQAGVTHVLSRALVATAARLAGLARESGLAALNEARHLQPTFLQSVRDVAATEDGIEVRPQLPAKCAEWPNLGGVDVAITVAPNGPVWVELKCGSGRDALGPCVWDAAKCAFGLVRGDAIDAYLVAGTGAAMWSLPVQGAEFFNDGLWELGQLRETYAKWWRFWERDGYPAGRRMPATFATQSVSSAAFYVAGAPWELRLARVSVPHAVDWIEWAPLRDQLNSRSR